VCIPDHLTWRALVTLGRAARIHTVLDRSQVARIPVDLSNIPVVYMLDRYRGDRPRPDNYREAVENILQDARTFESVCYLTLGHPLVLDSVAAGVIEGARRLRIYSSVVPGISFIDTMLIDSAIDVSTGIQIHEATHLFRSGRRLDASTACIIAQPAVFDNQYMVNPQRAAISVERLVSFLKDFYPEDHIVHVVTSHLGGGDKGQVSSVPIHGLADIPVESLASGSLFIPPNTDSAPVGDAKQRDGVEDHGLFP
jgi:uncharacterized protein YabN with tetrapyrrole methylase and pyrophosphatase domain